MVVGSVKRSLPDIWIQERERPVAVWKYTLRDFEATILLYFAMVAAMMDALENDR